MCKIVIFMVASLALISGQALADDVPPTPQSCSEIVKSMDWNDTALFGSWLELARNPNDNTNACMQFRAELLSDNKTLSFNASHSTTPTSLWQDINEPTQRLTLTPNATTGYSVTLDGKNYKFIKLLQLVQTNYLIGCGYTNAANSSTGYGFILGRDGKYNDAGIKSVNNYAAGFYKDFTNNNYTTILQDGCIRNSAPQSLPLITGFLALAILLIKAN
ncbi:uncharacterized protein LOC117790446 [Drosophila innubila]|uniref:uncharacterized protein LOC117790446 n=1 Tax=Drosophila innubila TaxID=198719 RepID=UPI00148C37FD|nr:uncharacterized protein LOC117790446 [Drosophila innubila]